jgi:hypothetical protein
MMPKSLYYWVGEKPPALPCRYEDEDGVLDASIAGATLTAKGRVGENAEFDVACTNTGDGTFTIGWATGVSASSFAHAGTMRIDIEVDDGTRVWFMPRWSIPIRDRAAV